MSRKGSIQLSINIVGGGIGGLAAAILLAQSGHSVTIFERRDADYEGRSTGGIALSHNSTQIIERLGLRDELRRISDEARATRMTYDTLKIVVRDEGSRPYFMVHRADFVGVLAARALEAGVDVQFHSHIESIQDSQDHVVIKLQDGREYRSDIVIGADGIDSVVRHTFAPNVSPRVTPCTVMLVNIPQSVMESEPATADLYHLPPFHTPWGPGRSIVSWAMTGRKVYHLQFCDYEYGNGEPWSFHDPPDAPYITELNDLESLQALQSRFADFDPRIRFICKNTTTFTKWKIAELPPLPSYCSPSRRVVLLGDAAHAIMPFAGQGANMAIEDGQTLATLLSLTSSREEVPDAMATYDKLRIPRLATLRSIIEINVRVFGMRSTEQTLQRDRALAKSLVKEGADRDAGELPDGAAPKTYSAVAIRDWMMEYDADGEARKAWAKRNPAKAAEAHI